MPTRTAVDPRRVLEGVSSAPPWVYVAACVLVAAGLSAYLLTLPDFLFGIHSFTGTGYDDGVYYGAADHFAHGVMPYRSFTFLQPPGAVVVLAPFGLLGRAFGTADGLAIARVVTLVVASVNAGLAAWAVRAHGRIAIAVAGLTIACFPLATTADHSLNLEPYLVVFSLLAAVIGFDATGGIASTRRLAAAGILLGVATDVKVWGVAPALALVVCCAPHGRRMATAAGGWVVGLLVVAVPFFALAPGRFWHQVLVAQLDRKDTVGALTVVDRLGLIFGVNDQSDLTRHHAVIVVMTIVVGLAVAACFATWRDRMSRFAWFALVSTVLLMAGLVRAQQFYDHYTYAVIAFLAMLVGVVVARYVEVVRDLSRARAGDSRLLLRAGWVVAVAALVAVAAVVVPNDASRSRAFLAGAEPVNPAIEALIPAGACVVTDDPILLIEANRWDSSQSGCPAITDPFGIFVANGGVPPPGAPPFSDSLVQPWVSAFSTAEYIVMSIPGSDYIPFNARLLGLVDRRFTTLYSGTHADILG